MSGAYGRSWRSCACWPRRGVSRSILSAWISCAPSLGKAVRRCCACPAGAICPTCGFWAAPRPVPYDSGSTPAAATLAAAPARTLRPNASHLRLRGFPRSTASGPSASFAAWPGGQARRPTNSPTAERRDVVPSGFATPPRPQGSPRALRPPSCLIEAAVRLRHCRDEGGLATRVCSHALRFYAARDAPPTPSLPCTPKSGAGPPCSGAPIRSLRGRRAERAHTRPPPMPTPHGCFAAIFGGCCALVDAAKRMAFVCRPPWKAFDQLHATAAFRQRHRFEACLTPGAGLPSSLRIANFLANAPPLRSVVEGPRARRQKRERPAYDLLRR